jgi:unsaturated chondroitin disaccharide hydrolase
VNTVQGYPATASEQVRQLSADEALDFAESQVRGLITRAPGRTPAYTSQGRWVLDDDPWAPAWCGGFLTGMMWVFARRHSDPWWRDRAQDYCRALEPRKTDQTTHDLGFVLEPSWGRWYDAEPEGPARDVLIEGGRTMAARLQRAGGYLSTWVDPGSTFIDVMMNVGIIFRAARYSGDQSLHDTALRHCATSRRFLLRGDGSTAHEGRFDAVSGEFLRASTHQGWRSDSSWARGQAWAIYGFTTAYRHTGRVELLDAACRAADYYIRHTPGGVPPNDWADPAPQQPWEASAAAVATAGLLHLHSALPPGGTGAPYCPYALQALRTLCSTRFIAADVPGWEGVLRHATYHHRRNLGVDESVMWGDYYFVEALELAASTGESS